MQFLTLHFHKVRGVLSNLGENISHVTLSNTGTHSLKYSPLRTESLDVVVKRAQNGALNIEIDFDNTLRFTGTQEEVQCYDVVTSVEGVEVTFKRSAFTALREVLRSNRKQESFRLQVKRIVEPPPVITNMMAFDRFVLRWNLWRYLPLKTQRRRLEMIRVAFSGEFFSFEPSFFTSTLTPTNQNNRYPSECSSQPPHAEKHEIRETNVDLYNGSLIRLKYAYRRFGHRRGFRVVWKCHKDRLGDDCWIFGQHTHVHILFTHSFFLSR